VADLPTTDNGKVRKTVLRETGVTADTWHREKETASSPGRRPADAVQHEETRSR
jgi:hypothetical protein